MNQSQFLAITCNSLEAREKWRVRGVIGFGFASHWLKNSFRPITKRSNRNHVITFDSHLKTALKRVIDEGNKAVFKRLSKNQYEINNSNQSQQEQRAMNQSWFLATTCSFLKAGKNRAYKVGFDLVLLLIGWKTGARFVSQSLSVAITITQLRSRYSRVIWKIALWREAI